MRPAPLRVLFLVSLISLVGLVLLSGSALALIVPNGNFETGSLSSWTWLQKAGGAPYVASISATAQEGSYGASLRGANGGHQWGYLYQDIDLTGHTNLTFWYKQNTMHKIEVYNAGTWDNALVYQMTDTSDTWVKYEWTQRMANVRFAWSSWPTVGGDYTWFIDDVRVDGVPLVQVPVAAFTSNVTSGYTPLTVQFNDTSSNTPAAWAWYFGDGATSSLQNPVHTYAEDGLYNVTLTASNSAGADNETKLNYIDAYDTWYNVNCSVTDADTGLPLTNGGCYITDSEGDIWTSGELDANGFFNSSVHYGIGSEPMNVTVLAMGYTPGYYELTIPSSFTGLESNVAVQLHKAALYKLRVHVLSDSDLSLFNIDLKYPNNYVNRHITGNNGIDEFPLGVSPPAGTYSITVSKSGFLSQTVSFLTPGDFSYYPVDNEYRCVLSVVMLPDPDNPSGPGVPEPGDNQTYDYQLYAISSNTGAFLPSTFTVYDNFTRSSTIYQGSVASNPPFVAWVPLVNNRTYMITATSPGYASDSETVRVYGGAQGIPFYLSAAGNWTFKGHVIGEGGVNLKCWILIQDIIGYHVYATEETDNNGYFDIPLSTGISASRLELRVSDLNNQYSVYSVIVDIPDDFPGGVYTANIQLFKYSSYLLNITVNGGTNTGFYTYVKWPNSVRSVSNMYMGSTISQPLGRAPDVGVYNVTVSKYGYTSQSQTATVPTSFTFNPSTNLYVCSLTFNMGGSGATPTVNPGSPTPGYQRMNDSARGAKVQAAINQDLMALPVIAGALIIAILIGGLGLLGGRLR